MNWLLPFNYIVCACVLILHLCSMPGQLKVYNWLARYTQSNSKLSKGIGNNFTGSSQTQHNFISSSVCKERKARKTSAAGTAFSHVAQFMFVRRMKVDRSKHANGQVRPDKSTLATKLMLHSLKLSGHSVILDVLLPFSGWGFLRFRLILVLLAWTIWFSLSHGSAELCKMHWLIRPRSAVVACCITIMNTFFHVLLLCVFRLPATSYNFEAALHFRRPSLLSFFVAVFFASKWCKLGVLMFSCSTSLSWYCQGAPTPANNSMWIRNYPSCLIRINNLHGHRIFLLFRLFALPSVPIWSERCSVCCFTWYFFRLLCSGRRCSVMRIFSLRYYYAR